MSNEGIHHLTHPTAVLLMVMSAGAKEPYQTNSGIQRFHDTHTHKTTPPTSPRCAEETMLRRQDARVATSDVLLASLASCSVNAASIARTSVVICPHNSKLSQRSPLLYLSTYVCNLRFQLISFLDGRVDGVFLLGDVRKDTIHAAL